MADVVNMLILKKHNFLNFSPSVVVIKAQFIVKYEEKQTK